MALVIDNEFLPATLTAHPMSDDEFSEFCSEHPDLFFEMSAEGEIIVMAPTYSLAGARNIWIAYRLNEWAKADGRGIVCDSSTGFRLPNGARRSPDASWTLKRRIEELDPVSREKFWHLCPDFVVELRSASDRLRPLREKMAEYLANGAQLGWLIDAEKRTVSIYRPEREVETVVGVESLTGEGPVAGFVLDLTSVWNPLAG
ncbi:MAG: Uma2 family endonuclease [Bryobacteraceae bacterium]